ICVIAVKAAPGSLDPISSPTIRRCADDEIGKNSVRPWTRPRTIASHAFTSGHSTQRPRGVPHPRADPHYPAHMELRQLGRTGLRVSSLGLGTMTWGRDTDEGDAGEQLRDFVDAGGNLVDTAASYGGG